MYRARTGAGRAWAPPRAHLIVAYFFPLFFAPVENYRIPPPLARFQPNQEHPAFPKTWRASVSRRNGRRRATGGGRDPAGQRHRCGKNKGIFAKVKILELYRSVLAYRKTHHFLIIFDFDIIFLRQNSCLSQNGWHHSIRLARNPYPPFHFRPIIDHLACIEVKGMK